MSKRKRPNLRKKKKPSASIKFKKITTIFSVVIVATTILLSALFWFSFPTRRVFLATPSSSGGVAVILFDPATPSVTKINIPSNTLVSVSRQLGEWKIGSIWDLGQAEGYDGKLLSETITKTFRIPVVFWADQSLEGLGSNKKSKIIKSFFSPALTNLSITDKLKVVSLALKVKPKDFSEINLDETSFLSKTSLTDGSLGYSVSSVTPPSILALCADPSISSEQLIFTITDEGAGKSTTEKVGKIAEALGAKVFSVVSKPQKDTDCTVIGKTSESLKQTALVLGCTAQIDEEAKKINISLGSKFAERF